jgi:cytochrome c peroxidase
MPRNSLSIGFTGFHLLHILAVTFLIILFLSCSRDDDDSGQQSSKHCTASSEAGTPYELDVPYFFPQPAIPADNPLTVEGVELGRHLFWETKLSRNNAVSCGSCHFPSASFADSAPGSTGLYGDITPRNSMALVNMAWAKHFFWDGRAQTLEEQLLEPVENPIEMDLTWKEAVERIGTDPEYQEMFTAAFGTPCVDSLRITYAMAQFIRTMISARSRFDKAYYYGEGNLTPSEIRGLELFLAEAGDPEFFPGGQFGGDCFHCHGGALVEFTNQQFHNNGLDSIITDPGRGGFTGFPFDMGLFKTPSLRNIALSAPYMHDGRFATLHDVMEHYNLGGHPSPTIDPLMKMQGVGLGLSPQSIDDIVNFLNSLTDEEFIENDAFSNPH